MFFLYFIHVESPITDLDKPLLSRFDLEIFVNVKSVAPVSPILHLEVKGINHARNNPMLTSGKYLIYPGHKKVILWDNNILASPYWRNIFDELEESAVEVDFNQGLDARLMTEETALRLQRLKIPIVRLAYDSKGIKESLKKTIGLLKDVGIDGRRIVVYCLYGYLDTPDDFIERIRELITWGVVAYPMRYQPLEPCKKDSYISPNWNGEQLEMIAKARRVIGCGGAFPPYEGLKRKFLNARTLSEAFELKPPRPR